EGAAAIATCINGVLDGNRQDSSLVRRLDEQIGGIDRQIALSGSLQKDTIALDIELSTPDEGDVTFSVSYVVRDASWRSAYEVALDSLSPEQKLDVTLVGEVMQRTGEDWQGTSLVVSTERPAFLNVPEPVRQQYRLDYRQ